MKQDVPLYGDQQQGQRPLDALFAPRAIAVVGASATPSKLGFAMVRSLASFPGALYPINPREHTIDGHRAYQRVADVSAHIDLAILTVSAAATPGALEECATAGVPAAMICSGGFGETGAEGRSLQERVLALLRETGMRLLGPNTSGFVNPEARLRASFVPGVNTLRPGSLSIIAQSGGVNHALAFLAHNEGVGIHLGVGLGNAIDVGFVDVLHYLASDEQTRVIALHIEGVADGLALIAAIEGITRQKPVVALKVGRADVNDFARSHTGALTGNWALSCAALRQAGGVVVEDSTELIDAARALVSRRLAPSSNPGIAVVTSQAGPGLLITDLLRLSGLSVPSLSEATREQLSVLLPPLTLQANPVDTGRPDKSLGKVLTAVGSDPSIDAIIAYALHEPDTLDPVEAIRAARLAFDGIDSGSVPVIFATGGPQEELAPVLRNLKALQVATYTSPERGARAMRALVADARAQARRRSTPPSTAPSVLQSAGEVLGPGPLDENETLALLEEVGIRTPLRRACSSRREAHEAMAEVKRATGRPVVVKVLDASIMHKSDVGGVYLGVDTAEDLEAALDAIDLLVADRPPRYLVEEMLLPGLELIVGGTRDASFGQTVLLGLGGVLAEALGDVALRLAPVTIADAAEMLDELAGHALLDGYRGQPGVNRAELIQVLVTVGQLLVKHPEIAELDINPLLNTRAGLYALDALIILRS
jgi:acyl-CoA synthetase (NDP forming)